LSGFNGVIKAIFIKDLLSEFRTRQTLPAMIVLGLLMAWIFRISTEAAPLRPSVTAAAVLLVSLLFSVILAGERVFAVEQHNDSISALLLAAVDAGDIYIAKLLVNITMLCVFEIIIVPAVFLLFNVNVAGRWLQLIVVLLLVNIGVSGVGTFLGCVVQAASSASWLLTVLVMAILCPMMIPAVFALLVLFGTIAAEVSGAGTLALIGDYKAALGFLAAFDAIYVTVCWLLFGLVVGE